MDTVIAKNINEETMDKAGEIIRKGGLVAFPTETVYGLGANAFSEDAVKKIYKAKGRPSDNPLIVHLSDVSEVETVAREIPGCARKLLKNYAPGPFTLILKKQDKIGDTVTAGLDTVGVRIPSHPVARKFIKAAGVPVAAPSANLSGKPSPTNEKHVIEDMKGRIDMIICGGSSEVGVESTIIDCTTKIPTILRPGGITPEDVASVCGSVEIDGHILKSLEKDEQPKCPGMKYKHYAPDADVAVVEGEKEATEKEIVRLSKEAKEKGYKVGVLAMENRGFCADTFICSGTDGKSMAMRLFDALRQFDEKGTDIVFAQMCLDEKSGLAVRNRLYKSAGGKIIYVSK